MKFPAMNNNALQWRNAHRCRLPNIATPSLLPTCPTTLATPRPSTASGCARPLISVDCLSTRNSDASTNLSMAARGAADATEAHVATAAERGDGRGRAPWTTEIIHDVGRGRRRGRRSVGRRDGEGIAARLCARRGCDRGDAHVATAAERGDGRGRAPQTTGFLSEVGRGR